MTKKRQNNNYIFSLVIFVIVVGFLFYSFNKEEEFYDPGTIHVPNNKPFEELILTNPFEELILVPPQDDMPFDGKLGGRIKK